MLYLHRIGTSAGTHMLFAARVRHWPFDELDKHLWEPWGSDVQTQLLERQLRFINALHPGLTPDHLHCAETFTVDLRHIYRPGAGQVDCVLVGKTSGVDEPAARRAAEDLAGKLVALLPLGYDLQFASEAEFGEWSGEDLARPEDGRPWAEVRRPAEYLLWTAREVAARRLPVVYPFAWHPAGWEAVWLAQTRLDTPSLVSVRLRPTEFPLPEETILAELAAEFRAAAEATHAPLAKQAEEFAELYTGYLASLRIPFYMRVSVLGARPLQLAVRNALSGPIWPPDEDEFHLAVMAEVVEPGEAHAPTVRADFERLELTPWDPYTVITPPAPFLERLRYLTGAAGALCAFRLPLLPPDGLPGVEVGAVIQPPP